MSFWDEVAAGADQFGVRQSGGTPAYALDPSVIAGLKPKQTYDPNSGIWSTDGYNYFTGPDGRKYQAAFNGDGSVRISDVSARAGGGAFGMRRTSRFNDQAYDIYKDGQYQGGGNYEGLQDGISPLLGAATVAIGGPLLGAGLAGLAAGGAAGAGAGAAGAGGLSGSAGTASLLGVAGADALAGMTAAELAAGAGLGAGAPLGAEALAAYSSLAGAVAPEAIAAAIGMTPEAFAALGAGGMGAAGAAGGQLAGTAAQGAGGSSFLDTLKKLGGSAANAVTNSGGGGMDWLGQLANLAGGIYGSKQAGDAADAQLTAAREAQALNEPFREGGIMALNKLKDQLGLGGNTSQVGDFTSADFLAGKDPGYQWRLDEGMKGLTRAAGASGGVGSGKFLKDAMAYNQGLASQEYGNAFNRHEANRAFRINPLLSMLGQGQASANQVGEYATQAGNAQAAGKVGQANAVNNAIGQGLSMYQSNNMMNRLFPNGYR